MICIIILLLQGISAQRSTGKQPLYVIGKNHETYKIEGYSSYNIFVKSIDGLLSDKIKSSYNFALEFSDTGPSTLLAQTNPEKLVFLQLLHSFDIKNSSFTNFVINVAKHCTFSESQKFRDWVNKNFVFPNERVYEIIKYAASTKPALQKEISDQIFFLNEKSNVFEKAVTKGDTEIIEWLLIHSPSNSKAIDFKTVEEAWKNGKVEIIKLIMKYGKINKQNLPNNIVNKQFTNNQTFLHIASRNGYVDIINLLITNLGANINLKDSEGKSPLFRAVENNQHASVGVLVGKGADITNEALLALAVEKGHLETIKFLINLGVSHNIKNTNGDTPFFLAVKRNNVKALEVLATLDESKRNVLNSTNEFGDTLMHTAAYKGHIDSVKALLKLQIVFDTKNNFGETPLHKAIERQNLEIINFLIKSGADLTATTNQGDTIMHLAASLGNKEIVKLLLSEKFHFPINIRNFRGETPLYKAAFSGKCEILNFLRLNGGDLNSVNDGMTMLHQAAAEGNEKAVLCLISNGMNVDTTGLWDMTPLHHAVSNGHQSIVERLLEKNANPNAKAKNLWTPLHRAVLINNMNIIKLLIKYGALLTAKNGAGETPYNVAVNYDKTTAAKLVRPKT